MIALHAFDLEGAAMKTSLGIWAFGPMVTRFGCGRGYEIVYAALDA